MSLTKLLNTAVLSTAVGISGLVGNPTLAYGEETVKEPQKKEQGPVQEYKKHDHSAEFYSSAYTIKNIKDLEAELVKHPEPSGYERLCDLWFENKDFRRTGQVAQEMIKRFPKDWRGYQGMAVSLGERGMLDQAWSFLERAKSLDPNHPEIFLSFGEIQNRRGNLISAISYFNQALKIKPDFEPARLYREEVLGRLSH